MIADWVAAIERALSQDERANLVRGAERLRAGLVGERELSGARYLDDAEMRGAYLMLYFPVSYQQTHRVLSEMGHAPGRVLDLGGGPGPAGCAALDLGASEVIVADRSRPALELAERIAQGRALTTRVWSAGQPIPDGKYDTIIVSHLLNELDDKTRDALVDTLLAALSPMGILLVIEPALKETSRRALVLRDRLVARGIALRFPCLYRGACPALVRESDWCHMEYRVENPPSVADLAKRAAVHRDHIKMTALAFSAPGAAWTLFDDARLYRVVSEHLPQKGRDRVVGCGPRGRFMISLLDRDRGVHTRAFTDAARGDVLEISEVRETAEGLRVEKAAGVRTK